MMTNLIAGNPAPDFDLPLDESSTLRLSALRGQKVVLYFYPKDDTSGCTKEAIEFNALKKDFESKNAKIIGMSPDDVKKHAKFKTKYTLDLDLVSDESKDVLTAYGVWVQKSMYGRKYMGVERTTFLINEEGVIQHVWTKVKVPGHAAEVLKALG